MPDFLSISWWRKVYQKVGRSFGVGCGIVFAVPLVIGFGWNQYAGRNQNRSSEFTGTIAAVNGDPITNVQYQAAIPNRGGSPEQYAETRGAVIEELEQVRIAQQLARKYNVHVPDADIDRKLSEEREQKLGKNASDDQWSDYVSRAHQGVTPAEYRDTLATDPQLLVTGLLNKFKEKETITPEDIQQYKSEVQMNLVQIGYGADPFQDPKKKTVPLTEAEAKKKADDLLAKAKSGASVADLAKANSTDFTAKKGGDTGFLPEYKNKSLEQSYGKEFAEAVHKTATGQITDVVPTSMFGRKGFAFAKIVARREAPAAPANPKNPAAAPVVSDPKKITDELKQQRASEKLGNEFKAAIKSAKLVFTSEGAEAKTYYDYYKLKDMQNKEMQSKMGGQFGQPVPDDAPKPGEIEAQQALVNSELEALYKKTPQDSNLAMLLAGTIKTQAQIAQGAQKKALETRLIQLYETALTGTEDRNVRFDLAELYRNQGDTAKAAAEYQKIGHLMDIAPGFDTTSLREEQFARKRLVTGFRALNKEAEASAEQQKYDALTLKIADAQRKEDEQRRTQSGAGGPGMGGLVPPGGSTTQTITAPPASSGRSPGKKP